MPIALMMGHVVINSGENMAADGMDQPIWSEEALRRVEHAPSFVRPGIYKLMSKRARERGRSVITSAFLTEIRNESMLRVAKSIRGFGFEELTVDAFEVAKQKMRRQPRKLQVISEILTLLAGRQEKNREIIAKFEAYLKALPAGGLPWTEEARRKLTQIPEFVRPLARTAIEEQARARREKVVTPEVVEAACRSTIPDANAADAATRAVLPFTLPWSVEAEARVRRIPIPFVRGQVIRRVETYAADMRVGEVDLTTYQAATSAGKGGSDWGLGRKG